MDQNTQGSADTGTRDDTYDVISVLYHALQGVENCELFADDASDDQELHQFFERACDQQRQLADEAKRLLQSRLMRDAQGGGSGSGSAFGQFGSASSSSAAPSGSMSGSSGQQSSAGSSSQPQETPDQFGEAGGGGRLQNTHMNTGGGGTSTF